MLGLCEALRLPPLAPPTPPPGVREPLGEEERLRRGVGEMVVLKEERAVRLRVGLGEVEGLGKRESVPGGVPLPLALPVPPPPPLNRL